MGRDKKGQLGNHGIRNRVRPQQILPPRRREQFLGLNRPAAPLRARALLQQNRGLHLVLRFNEAAGDIATGATKYAEQQDEPLKAIEGREIAPKTWSRWFRDSRLLPRTPLRGRCIVSYGVDRVVARLMGLKLRTGHWMSGLKTD